MRRGCSNLRVVPFAQGGRIKALHPACRAMLQSFGPSSFLMIFLLTWSATATPLEKEAPEQARPARTVELHSVLRPLQYGQVPFAFFPFRQLAQGVSGIWWDPAAKHPCSWESVRMIHCHHPCRRNGGTKHVATVRQLHDVNLVHLAAPQSSQARCLRAAHRRRRRQ